MLRQRLGLCLNRVGIDGLGGRSCVSGGSESNNGDGLHDCGGLGRMVLI